MNRRISLHDIADDLGADDVEAALHHANVSTLYDAERQTLPAWAVVHLLCETSLLRAHIHELMEPPAGHFEPVTA